MSKRFTLKMAILGVDTDKKGREGKKEKDRVWCLNVHLYYVMGIVELAN